MSPFQQKKEFSDIDIELEDQTEDDFYLKTLEYNLDKISRKITPQFIFFFRYVVGCMICNY